MEMMECIRSIISTKEAAGTAPFHALVLKDICMLMQWNRERVEKGLRELEAAGVIRIGNTINDRYVVVLKRTEPNGSQKNGINYG